MASCGYHSPQFSEDAAWLPVWLQPHQLPAFGGSDRKDGETVSHSSKNLASLQNNVCHGEDCQLFTNCDAKYSGCRLYLSGEDNSVAGTSPSSASALHFHLHLSSVDVSQISPSIKITESGYLETENSQLGNHEKASQSGNFEKNKDSFREPLHEAGAVQDGAFCQYFMKDGVPASALPICEPMMSHKRICEAQNKSDKTKRQKLHRKPDSGKLCNAIELSIAASEAMAISEIVSGSLHSEQLPAKAILEFALRVKQARNEPSDALEDVSALPADELDETDQLYDLDEASMADALSDVGISFTQLVGTVDCSNSDRKSIYTNSSGDLSTRISDSQRGGEAQGKKIQAGHVNEATSEKYAVLAIESISNDLPFRPLLVQHMKASVCAPLDCINSCVGSPSKADAQKLNCTIDAVGAIQVSAKDHGICKDGKDGKVVPLEVPKIRASSKLFKGETSFISESMDIMVDSESEHGPEAEPETVASSSTPVGESTRCLYEENGRSSHGDDLSQDLLRSSSLSLVDPLCSVVPCSISADETLIVCDYNQQGIEKQSEKLVDSAGTIGLQELNETPKLQNAHKTPLKPIVQGGDSVISGDGLIDPGMPSRKQLNSLKPYSMVMPDPCTSRQINANYGQILSYNRALQSLQFSPSKIKTTISSFVSDKEDHSDVPLKPMSTCIDMGGLENNHNIGAMNYEGSERPIGEINYASGSLLYHFEERNSPITLNNRKRLRACKVISIQEILKRSSATKTRKCRNGNSINGVKCRDQTNVKSCVSRNSSLRLHPADNQSFQKKRVRFAEAQIITDRTKSRESLHAKYQSHGTLNRRLKQSNLQCKSTSEKENYNYLICSQTVDEKGMILQGLEFLLTGFSCQKEKELETLIGLYGGYVLPTVPSGYLDLKGKQRERLARRNVPIVLSPKKVQTTKYLLGCATNMWMLNAHWLIDSIQAGSPEAPGKYMTQVIQGSEMNRFRIGEPSCLNNHALIFDKVGIMIYGKVSFCTKFSKIIKLGGGQVFKTLQRLVQSLKNGTNIQGTVIVENESNIPRHLKYCALENNLQTMPVSWIVNSLFTGKLLPFKKDRYAALHRIKMPTFPQNQDMDMSEEF